MSRRSGWATRRRFEPLSLDVCSNQRVDPIGPPPKSRRLAAKRRTGGLGRGGSVRGGYSRRGDGLGLRLKPRLGEWGRPRRRGSRAYRRSGNPRRHAARLCAFLRPSRPLPPVKSIPANSVEQEETEVTEVSARPGLIRDGQAGPKSSCSFGPNSADSARRLSRVKAWPLHIGRSVTETEPLFRD